VTINAEAIMQGRREVSLEDVYSKFRENGLDVTKQDKDYQKFEIIQMIAQFVLGFGIIGACFVTLVGITFKVPIASITANAYFLGSLGFVAAGGIVWLAACCAKHCHLSSVKLNASQVNQLLKNVKRAVEKQRADYLLSPGYKNALRNDTYLKQMIEKIRPDQRIQ
jgi:hypothetical protein